MRAVWPFDHFGLKLLSVGLAVLLWLAVAGEQTVERSVRVSLVLQRFPDGLELQSEPPSTVDVRVRGQASALASLTGADIVAALDLSNVGPGRHIFPLTPETIQAPYDVEVEQVIPSSLTLSFERTASRSVPVRPPVEGIPAPGFQISGVTSEPAQVEIVGPASAVAKAQAATTEPVDVTGASADVRRVVQLGLSDPQLRLRNTQTATVTVTIGRVPLPSSPIPSASRATSAPRR
jgi:YbbR domain-containing protein